METKEKTVPRRGTPVRGIPARKWGMGPINGDDALWNARMAAAKSRKKHFTHDCANCLRQTKHRTDSGECVNCFPSVSSNRILAREQGARTYAGECVDCGPTGHWTATGRCATCWTSRNEPRARPGYVASTCDARTQARLDRRATYDADCRLHGHVAHHTARGKCLSCYDTLGKPRDDYFVRYCRVCRAETVFAAATGCCIECDV